MPTLHIGIAATGSCSWSSADNRDCFMTNQYTTAMRFGTFSMLRIGLMIRVSVYAFVCFHCGLATITVRSVARTITTSDDSTHTMDHDSSKIGDVRATIA